MTSQNFATAFTVGHSAEEVFKAVTNVRGWWTGDIDGTADTLGAEFTYRYADLHHSRQQVTEAHDPAEWVGTEITFEIVPRGEDTEVRFAHEGLRSDFGCFDRCSSAWGFFVNGSLRRLITTGEGPATPPWEVGE